MPPLAVLACALALAGCGGVGMANVRGDSTTIAEEDRCQPTACGGTGDQALGISLVSIGVLVVGAAVREIVF